MAIRWTSHLLSLLCITVVSGDRPLATYDFTNGISSYTLAGTTPNFRLFAPFTTDGNISAQNGSLQINSFPFVQNNIADLPISPTLDHVKYMAFLAPEFETNATQDVVCKLRTRGWTRGTQQHPFSGSVDDNDYRLAGVGSINGDLGASLIADFYLTNTTLYAIYERLPFARTSNNIYAAFLNIIPIKSRQPSQIHNLAVRFSNAKGTMTWYADGDKVLTVDRIGMGISQNYRADFKGGQEEIIKPNKISCGFGTLSILDFYPSCTGPTGCPTDLPPSQHRGLVQLEPYEVYNDPRQCRPASFEFPRGTTSLTGSALAQVTQSQRLFGQGAVMQVYRIQAVAVGPDEIDI